MIHLRQDIKGCWDSFGNFEVQHVFPEVRLWKRGLEMTLGFLGLHTLLNNSVQRLPAFGRRQRVNKTGIPIRVLVFSGTSE
jgi:hypothetical protein